MVIKVRHKMPDIHKAIDRLDTMSKNVSSYVITEADTRLRFIIANTLNDAKEIMDEYLDKVDAQFKSNIDYILSAVHAIEERFYDQSAELGNRLIHAAPSLGSKKPLLLSI